MTEQRHIRWLLRAAAQVRECYVHRARDQVRAHLQPTDNAFDSWLAEVQRREKQLTKATRHGFTLCQSRLKARYEQALLGLLNRVESVKQQWCEPWHRAPALRDLFDELRATEDEFGAIEFLPREKIIAVQTEGIVLEGVPLGVFRIVLELPRITAFQPADWYVVEALNPNPASTNDDTVHPHVDGDRLCPGDALVPISTALRQGRLCDFFVLVRSVLETYNPHSAYVELENWDGVACHDCGYLMECDNSFYCERCKHDYCDECMSICEICQMGYCRGCLVRSELSGMYVCDSCLAHCSRCKQPCTVDELEDGLCSACREQMDHDQENDHDENDNQPTEESNSQENQMEGCRPSTNAGTHALNGGLAQTPVPLPRR